jgi:hypothetical protein
MNTLSDVTINRAASIPKQRCNGDPHSAVFFHPQIDVETFSIAGTIGVIDTGLSPSGY